MKKFCSTFSYDSLSNGLKLALKSTAVLGLAALVVPQAQAEGRLTVYCSVQNTTCERVLHKFGEKYQIATQFVRNSTGATLGKIKSEKNNPQADLWFGGTLEPHYQAAGEDLLAPYISPKQQEILPQFQQLSQKLRGYNSIIYLIELGIGVNTNKLAQFGLPTPQCFADLLKPEFKQLIQYPDPRVSGTGYSIIATLVQLWGEQKAFDYLQKLHKNVAQYSKTGLAVANLASGEVAVDLSFMPIYVREKQRGASVEGIFPCEGVGYSLGAVSIIKGARNLDNAKLFVDWILSAEAQEFMWREAESYTLPTNQYAQVSPTSVNPAKLNLIDIDFTRFGSQQEAKRLIDKWLEMTKGE